ncbi:MAG: alpha/beta fold hydrolase [Actinobacteria bacterium]|uniref:Unannotated protein n=1 Tax=freshwater metagenome TaxID=449393 RepID=A0A6J5ZV60_9ZZZZ|nr:alpha/beta fold hydrolase [Actinomycetota bacterium]
MSHLAPNSVLPARREPLTLVTADGLKLVGELALPLDKEPRATIVCVHPNPTGGGMMDSHLYRKGAWRLPALADVALLRFNTRGTTSVQGTSEGAYDEGRAEGLDLAAALKYVVDRGLSNIWLVGWSFGTNVVLTHGNVDPVKGAVLFSPTMKWSSQSDVQAWASSGRALTALVPELDDYLQPEEARSVFACVPQCRVVAIPECKHLWVGEKFVRIAWDEALKDIRPEMPTLDWQWSGPMNKWDDLQGRLV